MSRDMPRAFLEDVLANPDDDTPRLVYADWCEENGDDARAELIRVQIERTRLPRWDGRQVRLRLREALLVKQNEARWFKELPALEGVRWEGFRRGFVGVASFTSFEVLRENARAVWSAAPIEAASFHWPRPSETDRDAAPIGPLRELSLEGRPAGDGVVRFLADSPLLSTLRVLHFGGYSGPGNILRILAASPHLGALRAFRIPGSSAGNGGLRALIEADLPSLEELGLSSLGEYHSYFEDPLIQASGAEALAGWPGLARLRSLDLSGNDVGRVGLRALLRSPYAAGLKALNVRNCRLDGASIQELGSAVAGLRLEALDLGENVLKERGVANVAAAACLMGLKSLGLARCEVPLAGARELAKAAFLDGLRTLDVDDNNFGPAGLGALLDRNPPALHTLHIRDNDLFDKGAAQLAGSPASDTLLELDLGNNGLTDQAARALGASGHLGQLLVLRLTDNPIGQAAAADLAASPLGQRLAVLALRDEDELPFMTQADEGQAPPGDDIPF